MTTIGTHDSSIIVNENDISNYSSYSSSTGGGKKLIKRIEMSYQSNNTDKSAIDTI